MIGFSAWPSCGIIYSFLTFISLAQFVMAIITSALSCGGICCISKPNSGVNFAQYKHNQFVAVNTVDPNINQTGQTGMANMNTSYPASGIIYQPNMGSGSIYPTIQGSYIFLRIKNLFDNNSKKYI